MSEHHEHPTFGGIRRHGNRRLLYRWSVVALFALVLVLVVGGGVLGSTFAASFSAQTAYDTTSYGAATLTPPTALTANPVGKSIKLTWTKGATTPKTGKKQVVKYVDTKATTTCSSAKTFAALTSAHATTPAITATATTYTDATRSTKGTDKTGNWICYRLETAYGTSWTSTGAYAKAQAGYVATTVALTGKTGTITNTAEVIVTFNQKISGKPTSGKVCTIKTTETYAVILGDTTATSSATCTKTNTYTFGRLVSTVKLSATEYYATGTYTLSTGTKKLTIKFKGATGTKPTFTGTPKWTFIPYATLKSKTTPVAKICTTNTNSVTLCRPHVTTKKF